MSLKTYLFDLIYGAKYKRLTFEAILSFSFGAALK